MDRDGRLSKGACRRCHDRKVRCDISLTGIPCSSCQKDQVDCHYRSRKTYAPRKPRRDLLPAATATQTTPAIHVYDTTYRDIAIGPDITGLHRDPTPPASKKGKDGISKLLLGVHQQGLGYMLDAEVLTSVDRDLKNSMAQYLDAEELAFLSSKGVFSMPSTAVCEELIQGYFHYVHPVLPIIDAPAFIDVYEREGIQGSNLLLIWSIFHAGASYISDAGLAMTNHQYRKDLKATCFSRARALFSQGSERDSTILVQSSLLLSMWHSVKDDGFQPWYWIGTAITIAQIKSMHRNQDDPRLHSTATPRQRRLWRRLWWICVYRDRFSTVAHGRPMRINFDDCDVGQPTEEDITTEDDEILPHVRAKYCPLSPYASYWIRLVQLTIHLGTILEHNYRPRAIPLSYNAIFRLESELYNCIPVNLGTADTPAGLFYAEQLSLHRDVSLISLFRKGAVKSEYQTESGNDSPNAIARVDCRNKIKAVAANCNSIMERIIENGQIQYISPSSLALGIPVMQAHLTEAKSNLSLVRTIALSRLDFWLNLLSEIEHLNPAAEIVRKLFQGARDHRFSDEGGPSRSSSSSGVGPSSGLQASEQPQLVSTRSPSAPAPMYDDSLVFESWSNMNWDSTPESLVQVEAGLYASSFTDPTP